MNDVDLLIDIALDMTAGLTAEKRNERLLTALRRAIPYDAAALLRLEGDVMTVTASAGLTRDAMGRRFRRSEHPRLDIICSAEEPVRFPADAAHPDPFDGLLLNSPDAAGRIHSCLGCPLRTGETLIGALTADPLNPHAFDDLDLRFLKAIASLAGAQLQTIDLIRALEVSAERLGLITRDLMQDARETSGLDLLGRSEAMNRLRREIDLVAPSDFCVLVTGETGVGKELVVRAIHAASRRRDQPMLYLNCAALPETLAESELFGHVRGAFTGASADRAGKFELADGGTLFLDEIGELPLTLQPKLLRVLQQGELQRVGSDQALSVDVRLLAATNRDLDKEVRAGRFRADLFHRLNVYPLHVAPLRDRGEDIPLLAGHFCQKARRRLGLGPVRLEAETIERLARYDWPGNVRELENVLSRAVLKASFRIPRGGQVLVGPGHLEAAGFEETEPGPAQREPGAPPPGRAVPLREAVDRFQADLILQAVNRNSGNWAAAGRDLGINRSNLSKLAARLGLRNRS